METYFPRSLVVLPRPHVRQPSRLHGQSVKDLGEEKAGEIGGLLRLSQCSTKNPERDTRSLLANRLGLALDVPLRTISGGKQKV